jgi:ATP-dependent DNA helicase PIF1
MSNNIQWPEDVTPSDEFARAIELAQQGNNLFITGRAGTGKSTLLRCICDNLITKPVIVAPTGLAAINVGGQTIHSFFRLPPQLITLADIRTDDASLTQLLRATRTLVIDEVSMIRPDLMEGMDVSMRLAKNIHDLPFGGTQVILVGDLHQLPPVVSSKGEGEYLDEKYGGFYFFNSDTVKDIGLTLIDLKHTYRQNEKDFLDALEEIRIGNFSEKTSATINRNIIKFKPEIADEYTVLVPTNNMAANINHICLSMIDEPEHEFTAKITGNFKRTEAPTEECLTLKVGARVVIIRNDPMKRWVNGTMATISNIENQVVYVEINGKEHILPPATWGKVKFVYDRKTKQIATVDMGSFTQIPVKLAWGMTIHKSQGMTLDKVYINFGRGTFAHGQAYVVLSRCRTLGGLALARRVEARDIIFDSACRDYVNHTTSLAE